MTSAELSEFEDLAVPLFDSLCRFARWLARNQSEAEDLVQETYLKAQSNFDSFVPGSNPRSWMFRILKNTFLSSRSKLEHKRTEALEVPEEIAVFSNPESLLISHLHSEAIQHAVMKLPIAFREVLSLRCVEEASYGEISELLAIPIGTVMSRLARARKLVRRSCQNQDLDQDLGQDLNQDQTSAAPRQKPHRRAVPATRAVPAGIPRIKSTRERISC